MTRSRALILGLAMTVGCSPAAGEPLRSTLAVDGATLSLELPQSDRWTVRERDGWLRLGRDEVVIRVQTIPVRRGRTVQEAAAALVARYELGERPGELTERPCRYAGRDARCVEGTFLRDGAEWARRGAVFGLGRRLAWVDVVAPAGSVGDVEEWSDRVASTATVVEFEGS